MDVLEGIECKKLRDLKREDFSGQCFFRNGCVVLAPLYEYEIELDRCDSPEKLLAWAFHLSGKRWMNRRLLRHFIKTVAAYHDISLRVSA